MAMNTLVQVSVVDSSTQQQQQQQPGKGVESGRSGQHQAHRESSGSGPLPDNWDLSFSDNSLLSVYCFVKNFIGAASSGASTVAIDNKIEQAMDLVKSHLMFAVREEVEVLKEKITELLERISQLEHENDILRANASPETLKQLNQSQKKFTSHSVIGKQQNVVSPHVQNQPPPS